MHKIIISIAPVLLLTACSDMFVTTASTSSSVGADSEVCRATVAEQLSREHANLSMSNEVEKSAFDQRYRFCMSEKGYSLPAVTP